MPPEDAEPAGLSVVYIAAGDPFEPREGMDLVSRIHLEGLLASSAPVEGFICHHSHKPDASAAGLRGSDRGRFCTFASDESLPSGRWQRLWRKAAFLLAGGFPPSIGFRSAAARKAIGSRIARGGDVIVIDHLHAAVNVPMRLLAAARRRGSRIVYISHDFTGDAMMDLVRLARNPLKKAYLLFRTAHALMRERRLGRIADRVVHISSYDRGRAERFFGADPARNRVILPTLRPIEGGGESGGGGGDFLIFVGAPGHAPNRLALEWIASRFVPAYVSRFGAVRTLFVGKGTDRYTDPALGIEGLGFVDDAMLDRLLRSAGGLLCPIEHGSGIKIKLLDAISRGCLVLATDFSLRGYEELEIPVTLFADDPERSAANVHHLLTDAAAAGAQRSRTGALYAGIVNGGKETLAGLVNELARSVG